MAQAATPQQPLELLTPRQAATIVGISHRRLGDPAWRRRFAFPAYHVGGSLRFDAADVRRWLAQQRECLQPRVAGAEFRSATGDRR
jgi:hypothetical protein